MLPGHVYTISYELMILMIKSHWLVPVYVYTTYIPKYIPILKAVAIPTRPVPILCHGTYVRLKHLMFPMELLDLPTNYSPNSCLLAAQAVLIPSPCPSQLYQLYRGCKFKNLLEQSYTLCRPQLHQWKVRCPIGPIHAELLWGQKTSNNVIILILQ